MGRGREGERRSQEFDLEKETEISVDTEFILDVV
jgi:hypothetical protein